MISFIRTPLWVWISAALAFPFVYACLDPVSISHNEGELISVQCIMTEDSLQQVHLEYASGNKGGMPVDTAIVQINDGWFIHSGYHSGDGVWVVPLTPESGREYQLEIEIPGLERIHSSTTFLDNGFEVEAALFQPTSFLNEDWAFDMLKVYEYLPIRCQVPLRAYLDSLRIHPQATTMFHAMPGVIFRVKMGGPFYVLGAIHHPSGELTPVQYLATNHLDVDNTNAITASYVFDDYYSPSGNTVRDRMDKDAFSRYDGLMFHEGFLRIDQSQEYDNGVRNIYNVSSDLLHATPDFGPMEEANQYFIIVGNYPIPVFDKYETDTYPLLFFCKVDEAYDRYLKYVYERKRTLASDPLSALYEDSRDLPNNIVGGIGIFGSIRVITHRCNLKLGMGQRDYFTPPLFDTW